VTLLGKLVTSLDPSYLSSIFPKCNSTVFVAPENVVSRYVDYTSVRIAPNPHPILREKRVHDEAFGDSDSARDLEGYKIRLLHDKRPQLLLTYTN
jgi:hypothetical protein